MKNLCNTYWMQHHGHGLSSYFKVLYLDDSHERRGKIYEYYTIQYPDGMKINQVQTESITGQIQITKEKYNLLNIK